MRVLITSARFPHALAEIRWFGQHGHPVYAADTFRTSPGTHSRYVAERLLTASPRFDTAQFVADVEEIIRSRNIDLLAPACEEVFYLARHADRLGGRAELFFPPFETLRKLHDKRAFVDLARSLGLRVPETRVARSDAELQSAIRALPEYLARPAYSRGGTELLGNAGPFKGRLSPEDCHPTPQAPWIVQEFLDGTCVCSFSVARHGRLTAHCTYEHPKSILNSGGVSFVSIDSPEAVDVSRCLIEATGYHGQISLDFMRYNDRLYLLECNPRPTAGVTLMPAGAFVDAVCGRAGAEPYVVPAGMRSQVAAALVRDMILDWHAIPSDVKALVTGGEDVYLHGDDAMPALYSLLSYSQVLAFRRHEQMRERSRTDLVRAQFYDIEWDGRPIAETVAATGTARGRRGRTSTQITHTESTGGNGREQDMNNMQATAGGIPLDEIGPERVHHVYDPHTGMRAAVVIDTTRFGMSGGGVRMAPDLQLTEIGRLARAMTYKNAMIDLPVGGAKAGIWFDPADPGRGRVMTAFLEAIRPLTETGAFMPGPDMGTTAADFDPVYGRALTLSHLEYEGMPLEDQLTGYGVVVSSRRAMEMSGASLRGARVALEGFGKVGAGAAKYFAREGAVLVAVSNIRGALFDPRGLDVDALLALRHTWGDGALEHYSRAPLAPAGALFEVDADVLVPGARPDSIHVGNADAVKARWIVPAANSPYDTGAIERLHGRGVIALPDFVTNAGGAIGVVINAQGGSAGEAMAAVGTRVSANVLRVLEASRNCAVSPYEAGVQLAREALGLQPAWARQRAGAAVSAAVHA